MIRININEITPAQLKRLESGKTVQFKHKDIKDQTISDRGHFFVHPDVSKRLARSHAAGSGFRVTLTHPELQASGQGFRDAWNWIKNKAAPAVVSAAKFVKSKVIDSPFYQQSIRPELHNIVSGLESNLPQNVVGTLIKKGVDVVGEKTGAFGIEEPKKKSKSKPRSKKNTKGGSFMPIGGSFVPL